MSLELIINNDIKTAMKAKEDVTLRGLRAIKSAILLAKTAEGASENISTEDEIKLLSKLVKQRRDSLTIYEQQQRPERRRVPLPRGVAIPIRRGHQTSAPE